MSNFSNTYLGKYAISFSNNILEERSKVKKLLIRTIDIPAKTIALKKIYIRKNMDVSQSTSDLFNLSNNSRTNLFSAKTVFPFVLFPGTLKIDKQKLTIVHNDFMRSSQTTSIRLKDLQNVETELGPFFGTIILTSKQFLNNTQSLNFMRRRDAVIAQRLLQGFMVAHDSDINTDNIEESILIELLEKIGKENLN